MSEFEVYRFSRMCITEKIEFFFIIGVNDADNFNEYWDGTLTEVIGYLVIFTNHSLERQEHHIYLIENKNRDFEHIIKYTKQFSSQMRLSKVFTYDHENFIIKKTNVRGDFVMAPYVDFVRKIVCDDLPQSIIDEIDC